VAGVAKGVDFTQDELRTILKHEWQHIRSKDYLITYFVHLLCCIFWWNPFVYVLKSNVFFAQEVGCDHFTIVTSKDLKYFTNALLRIYKKPLEDNSTILGNAFVSLKNSDIDRYELLALRFSGKPRKKRVLAHVCFYIVIGALFVSSYLFVVLPVFGESNFEHVDIGKPIDCTYREKAYRAEETFIIDNGDGTFSFYIDGQHIGDRSAEEVSQDVFTFFPTFTREEWEGGVGRKRAQ